MGALEDQLRRLATEEARRVVPDHLGKGLADERRRMFLEGTGDERLLVCVKSAKRVGQIKERLETKSAVKINKPHELVVVLTLCVEHAGVEDRARFFPTVEVGWAREQIVTHFVDVVVLHEDNRADARRLALEALAPTESVVAPPPERSMLTLLVGATPVELVSLLGMSALLAVSEFAITADLARRVVPDLPTRELVAVALALGVVLAAATIGLVVGFRRLATTSARCRPEHLRVALVAASVLVHLVAIVWLAAPVALVGVTAVAAALYWWRLGFLGGRAGGPRVVPMVEVVIMLAASANEATEPQLVNIGLAAIATYLFARTWLVAANQRWRLVAIAI